MAKSSDQLYEGEWRNGEPCGRGLLKDSLNGIVYEGEMQMGGQTLRGRDGFTKTGPAFAPLSAKVFNWIRTILAIAALRSSPYYFTKSGSAWFSS